MLFKHITIRTPSRREIEEGKSWGWRSEGLVSFLFDYEHIRGHVQDLYIERPALEYGSGLASLHDLLKRLLPLLPLLPRLRHIQISNIGSASFSRDSPETSTFFEAVRNLNRNVRLSIVDLRGPKGGYVHTYNPRLLNDVNCLQSLRVSILNAPKLSPHCREMEPPFDGTPSLDIANLISKSPGLKYLHLQLDGTNHGNETHELEVTETEHALENIGHFTHQAWFVWQGKLVSRVFCIDFKICIARARTINKEDGHSIPTRWEFTRTCWVRNRVQRIE
ncbi:hypothetical protein BDV96DRAFT_220318 [Lophiotrema nucula]|uniref:Uncharacterized protein n=1 Tax=Lophiotrema nucula TaxID=690887 RepID=A0A6A5YV83_9PLEO|nr:hypothetical protein BDV96DRAFT_220318 [Lophiotrema nucula]